jgi:4'-phosphopantetheinyl transferase
LDRIPADHFCLSADEVARAGKSVFPQHRHRFSAMRSVLRRVLGGYAQVSPGSFTFLYGAKGKPSLGGDQNRLNLRFNVSHSSGLGIIAITSGREVGVDVETRGEIVDYMGLARRFFSPREHQPLAALPEELGQKAFLRCWARKEAYIKALGTGLSCPLRSFAVSVSPELSTDALLETSSPAIYHVSDVALPDPCVAALAIEGRALPRCCWTYTHESVLSQSAV